jgi:uncharacterized membrane protein YebE (DUF533 family)
MDVKALVDDLLKQGRDLASQGKDLAEQKLGIPEAGPERDATLSAMGKGALAAGALALLFGTGTGRKVTGTALKVGGLAALGGVAYKAYQQWQASQAGQTAQTADAGTPVDRLTGPAAERRSVALLRAMIAAANADGHIDEAERKRIADGIARLGLQGEALRTLEAEVKAPLDPAGVARGADSPEAAAEIYLASFLVLDVDQPAERRYLDELARHLRLDPELARGLESQARARTA